ncbi:MAG: PhoH family protein [Bradymonadia bacterium]
MKKTFVLDTNVMLHEPRALFNFQDNRVVVPIYAVEEVDQFKRDVSELGRNAREFSRLLDKLREQGSLKGGIDLESGGELRIMSVEHPQQHEDRFLGKRNQIDSLILSCAWEIQQNSEDDHQVILVTKDTNLRVRADALGIKAVDYDPEKRDITELYQGHRELMVSPEQLEMAFQGRLVMAEAELHPNEYVTLVNESRPNHTALARYDQERAMVRTLSGKKDPIWGIKPRNREQQFALDLLLDDKIKLVTIVGKAGTGKTLLAIAAGLHQVTEVDHYQRVLVSRPIFPLGRDIGYLPGTLEEKLNPWMKPIFDNVELLMGLTSRDVKEGRGPEELIDMGILEIEPLTYIRGRSIPQQYMIVDEAQNLTPHEVKTILTRSGHGTKVVFTGDPYQIDNPYVDANTNGLIHLVNRFKDQKLAGTVTLTKGERSELAELASNIL